jgi:Reverse transcriptase (RNA-dependent DNA polymerase)
LAQGVGGRIKGTDTITFIPHHEMPADRQATYPRFVCSERPQKQEKNRTRMTVGGNLISYPGDKSTRTAELETSKILFNSVVSTPNAQFCTMDITNFYLNTLLDRPEYLRIPCPLNPDEIMEEYQLHKLIHNGNVIARIDKGMYGLPQAGILANKLLKERLEPHGYSECDHTPGLWKHKTRPIMFSLVVDDFGVQYSKLPDAHHLLAALKQNYEAITVDWTGALFCGISLKWDYTNRTVDLSMPGYISSALAEFDHNALRKTPPNFSTTVPRIQTQPFAIMPLI